MRSSLLFHVPFLEAPENKMSFCCYSHNTDNISVRKNNCIKISGFWVVVRFFEIQLYGIYLYFFRYI